MKTLLIAIIAILPGVIFAQETATQATEKPPTIVSISAAAKDVRAIIADLFTQAKVNYVLEPGIQSALFLNLDKVTFEDALRIVCVQAKLSYTVDNGIYFIKKAKAVEPTAVPATRHGKLDAKVLSRTVTIKLKKTDMREAFAKIGSQIQVPIEVDKSVPQFKVDIEFTKISLKDALQKVCSAADLSYRFTDNFTIQITKQEDANKVSISG